MSVQPVAVEAVGAVEVIAYLIPQVGQRLLVDGGRLGVRVPRKRIGLGKGIQAAEAGPGSGPAGAAGEWAVATARPAGAAGSGLARAAGEGTARGPLPAGAESSGLARSAGAEAARPHRPARTGPALLTGEAAAGPHRKPGRTGSAHRHLRSAARPADAAGAAHAPRESLAADWAHDGPGRTATHRGPRHAAHRRTARPARPSADGARRPSVGRAAVAGSTPSQSSRSTRPRPPQGSPGPLSVFGFSCFMSLDSCGPMLRARPPCGVGYFADFCFVTLIGWVSAIGTPSRTG